MTKSRLSRACEVAGWNAAATAVVLLMSLPFVRPLTPAAIARHALICLLYSNCIGTLISLTLESRAFGALWGRLRFPINWSALVGVIVLTSSAGCLAATSLLVAAGLFPAEAFWTVARSSLVFSVTISLMLGVGGFIHDT